MQFVGQNPPPFNITGQYIPPPGDVGQHGPNITKIFDIPVTQTQPTVADFLAPSGGTVFSPLSGSPTPVIIPAPASNSLLIFLLIGGGGLALYLWYKSRHHD